MRSPKVVHITDSSTAYAVLTSPDLGLFPDAAAFAHPDMRQVLAQLPTVHDSGPQRDGLAFIRGAMSPSAATEARSLAQGVSEELLARLLQNRPADVDLTGTYADAVAPEFMARFWGLTPAIAGTDLRALSSGLSRGSAPAERSPDSESVRIVLEVMGQLSAWVQAHREGHLGPLNALLTSSLPNEVVTGTLAAIATGGQETVGSATTAVLVGIAEGRYDLAKWGTDSLAIILDALGQQPPISVVARTCLSETNVASHRLAVGDAVLVDLLGIGPSCPALVFGAGHHRCLGRPLALMLVEAAVNAVLSLWKSWPPRQLRTVGARSVGVFSGPAHVYVSTPDNATR